MDKVYYIEAMAEYKYKQGDYNAAITQAEDFFKLKENSFFENITSIHKFLAKAYEKIGNTPKAYEHHKKYAKLRDNILAIQNVRAFTYYQTLYETEKKEAEIQFQNAQISKLDSDNKIKNQWFILGSIGILALFSILWLVRSRRFARKKQTMHQNFSRKLINGQEEERKRVACELHDSVGQKLMMLSRKAKNIEDSTINELTGSTLQELREVLKGLHPSVLEKLGLSLAIQSLINDIDANTPIFFTSEIDTIDPYLNKETSLHFYRIIQEVLSNIIKHSKSKSVNISITKEEKGIKTLIKDNGKGFNFIEKYKNAKSLGLKILLERAKIINSKIEIDSILGKGTTVIIHTPYIR